MSALQDILADNRAEQRTNGHTPAFDIVAEPPRKRPRVNQACETCRERKTRCDGQQPICKACEKRNVGHTCSYIRQKRASTGHDVHYVSPVRTTEARPFEGGFAAINHRSFDSPTTKSEEIKRPLPVYETSYIDRPSSVTALFRSISDEPAKTNDVPSRQITQWRPTSVTRTAPSSEPERLSRSASVAPVLPRRRDADSYVQSYWASIHPLYPILHKPNFLRTYDKLWTADDEDRNDFDDDLVMATVNMVFAIGSRFSRMVADEHKATTADDFYQRARRSFNYDVLDTASTAMIQFLILNVIYLQSTHLANRCHNMLGLAVRAAQTIGMNERAVIEGSQVQKEMRRRIWHTCALLERMNALTFGRPPVVLKSTLPLPTLIDDEYLLEHGIGKQPEDKEPILTLFNLSCRMFDEGGDAINVDTAPLPGEDTVDTARRLIDRAVTIVRRIDDFDMTVPKYLRGGSGGGFVSGPARVLQNLLEIRIRFNRMFMTRSVLFFNAEHNLVAPKNQLSAIDHDSLVKLSQQAIHDAQKVVVILYGNMREGVLLGAWHALYVAITCLMIFLAALKSPGIDASEASIEHSWDQAFNVLEYSLEQIGPAPEALRILRGLKQHILRTRPGSERDHLPGVTGSIIDSSPMVNGHELASDLLELLSRESLQDVSLAQHFLPNMSWLGLPRRADLQR